MKRTILFFILTIAISLTLEAQKISEMPRVTGATIPDSSLIPIVDTAQALAANKNKAIFTRELKKYIIDSLNAGSGTIGAGDTLRVAAAGLTSSGIVIVSYKTSAPLEADTVASWKISSTGYLTLMGKYNWIVSYLICKK